MKRSINDLLFPGVIAAIIFLMAMQLYWFKMQYGLQEVQVKSKATQALKKTVAQLSENSSCFDLYSKLYIKGGEGFYMTKPQWDTVTGHNGKILSTADTVAMFFVGEGRDSTAPPGRFQQLLFASPMIADIHIKFKYEESDTGAFSETAKTLSSTLDPLRVKEIVSSASPFFKQFDTLLVKDLLKKNLGAEGLSSPFMIACIRSDSQKLMYLSPGGDFKKVSRSRIKASMNESSFFSKPYEIYLDFKDPDLFFTKGMLALFIISGFILIGLAFGVWYFVWNMRQYKKLVAVKNDFISNLSHEFNTPVTNISLAIETLLIQKNTPSQEAEKILRIMGQENNLLKENVEKILQISHMENEFMKLDKRPTDLEALIKETISGFDSLIRLKKAGVTFHNNGTQLYIGEANSLRNVLNNLIDNALKYCHQVPLISIDLRQKKDLIVLTVSDNGIGISKEQIGNIFQKFYRVPKGDTHDVKGFGLGLAYVKQIVTAHGGYIEVSSTPGRGSSFIIYLPLTS